MPRRELSHPHQVHGWLQDWGQQLRHSASMVLIGSAALLWHAGRNGITAGLPENSMDADPVTDSDELAWLCYEALIGSEFEQKHGWKERASTESCALPSRSRILRISSPQNSAGTSLATDSMQLGRASTD
jgi:hypothetical protein